MTMFYQVPKREPRAMQILVKNPETKTKTTTTTPSEGWPGGRREHMHQIEDKWKGFDMN